MSELTSEQVLEQEIARLTLALRNAHKDSMEMSIDRAKVVKENAALRAKVEELEQHLSKNHQYALELEAKVEALEQERDEWLAITARRSDSYDHNIGERDQRITTLVKALKAALELRRGWADLAEHALQQSEGKHD